ncbi:ImmA/IrrE family metallo-endopeptidase [Paenibacillus sp. y28]|uniref:ImmA/IrrE family metallo-endopeptidase n=1 Tax=Paenibacillus sp. y28 TaxID=3129110 RepID=UPI003016F5F1
MKEIIHKLVRRFKTNCPFEIAEGLGIHIRYSNLGDTTRGIYFRKLRRRFIVIHEDLSEEWQRFVCAHELGHDRLHKGISRFFIEEHTFFEIGRYERQANQFATHLLLAGSRLEEDETLERYLQRHGVPAEMGKYY